jgi:hypothetical protein
MEGNLSGKQRSLTRVDEPHRLEADLWIAVYERICPLVRRRVKQRKSAVDDEYRQEFAAAAITARRA